MAPSDDDSAPRSVGTLRIPRGGGAPEAHPEVDWCGRILAGRYALIREVGRGGMGIVYEARHVALGRRVAVKVLRPELARTDDALVRFEREAKAAAAVGSAHIVEVLDFGREATGEAWMVMEFLEGEDLAARIRRSGPLSPREVIALLRALAEALRDAHARGIVHRDLKSENVFLARRDGREVVKVVDFGISKVLDDPDATGAPTRDVLLGTPHYMAPEYADPDASRDHRVDLYALGCIAFEALTGRLPYAGRTPVEVLYQHAHAPIPRAASFARVPRGLDALVRRLLAKSPDARPRDAAALLDALDRVRAEDLGGGRRLALLAAVALAVGGILALRRAPSPSRPALAPAPATSPTPPTPPPSAPSAPRVTPSPTPPRPPQPPAPLSRAVQRARPTRPSAPAAVGEDAGTPPPSRPTAVDLLKLSPYARADASTPVGATRGP